MMTFSFAVCMCGCAYEQNTVVILNILNCVWLGKLEVGLLHCIITVVLVRSIVLVILRSARSLRAYGEGLTLTLFSSKYLKRDSVGNKIHEKCNIWALNISV